MVNQLAQHNILFVEQFLELAERRPASLAEFLGVGKEDVVEFADELRKAHSEEFPQEQRDSTPDYSTGYSGISKDSINRLLSERLKRLLDHERD